MPDRLPAHAETTAYFVVAEALTNPVRHARATGATVRAVVRHGALELEIRDDGAGGADPRHGAGLTGLADRVESIGGTITLTSPPGTGTTITAQLPTEWPADADVAGNANRRATDSPTRESLPSSPPPERDGRA